MNINTQSVMKAGGIGAAVNVVLGLLGAVALIVPALGILTTPLLCCGGLLIPIIAGALYGYFTPGKETIGQGAGGGAASGFAAGLIYGIFNSIATAVVLIVQGGEIADVLTGSAATIIGSCCGAIIFGSILGAVGGAVWVATQGNK